jgi:YjbE family integral membrane protein
MTELTALISVIIIDIVLAGDNAIVVGMAASGLPPEQRRRVIIFGIAAATVLRIVFAAVTMQLLAIVGLMLAGGILLLWVAWKMYRDIRDGHVAPAHAASAPAPAPALALATDAPAPGITPLAPRKTVGRAITQVIIADVSMSLDNVLAVAGVAHQSATWILVVGLALSVALMGVAATFIARLLNRYPWISWVGLGIITIVALRMIWDGSMQILNRATASGFSFF